MDELESYNQLFVIGIHVTSILYNICYCFFVIFIWWSPFIPSRNLDEVFHL